MIAWSPWKGCRKCSEGCKYCTSQHVVKKHGKEEVLVEKSKQIGMPIEKVKNEYKIPAGELISVCPDSDFFLPDADKWRDECWKIMKQRRDLTFVLRTRRIERFYDCIPSDWQLGYDNVIIAVAVENQAAADERLSIFRELPIQHRAILCEPLLELIDLQPYLENIELVMAMGEASRYARPLNFEWLPDIRWQCISTETHFIFQRCGTHFIKDGRKYTLNSRDQAVQAKKYNINYYFEKREYLTKIT